MKVRTPLILSTKTAKKLSKDNCRNKRLTQFCPWFRTGFRLFRRADTTVETEAVSSSTDLCNNVL